MSMPQVIDQCLFLFLVGRFLELYWLLKRVESVYPSFQHIHVHFA